jgi:hypothetical protein
MSIPSFCRRAAAFTLALASVLGHAVAQTISVGNGGSVSVGQTPSVTYHDPSRANQTIAVTITSSGPTPTAQEHFITLDGDGRGSFTWTVPNWTKAYFNAPGASELSVPIM